MSLLDSIADLLYGKGSINNSADNANYDRMKTDAQAMGVDLTNFGGPLQDPGAVANSQLINSLTFGALGTPDPNNKDKGTGWLTVLEDWIILAGIVLAIFLFLELGGLNQLKKLAS